MNRYMQGGELGMILAIHIHGEYFNDHSYIHAVVADGLFRHTGIFHVMGRNDTSPLEKLFQNKVL